ncbi:hypothetical protein BGX33_005707 [Mortierella sp. NVP41]|nr:hypothetical protein BGX33_005707 [Mortierella sp. NVP41]
MVAAIQNGRYKIWRSPEQLLVSMNGPNSMAVLGHLDDLVGRFDNSETGIWIVNVAPTSTTDNDVDSSVSATIQHEASQGYLALDNPSDPGRGATIFVQVDNKQAWTITPAARGEGSTTDEFHIGYPEKIEGQSLVVDNSFLMSYPPRLALQPADNGIPGMGLPWRFEPVA